MSDDYLEHELHRDFTEEIGLGELQIEVRVEGESIHLTGAVSSEDHHRRILAIVGERCPDHEVVDHLEVTIPPPPGPSGSGK